MSKPSDKPISEASTAADNPFASPAMVKVEPGLERKESAAVAPYVSGHLRAIWAMGLLAAVVIVDFIQDGLEFLRLSYELEAVRNVAALAQVAWVEMLQRASGMLQLALILAAAVAYFFWSSRIYRNLPALEAGEVKPRSGSVVKRCFISSLKLFRRNKHKPDPSQVGSLKPDDNQDWPRGHVLVAALVGVWWLFQLIRAPLFRAILRGEGWDALFRPDYFFRLADFADLLLLFLTFLVVQRCDNRQTTSAQRIDAAASNS